MLKVRCMWNLGAIASILISSFGDHAPAQNWVQSDNSVRCFCIMCVMCVCADLHITEGSLRIVHLCFKSYDLVTFDQQILTII